MPTNTLDTGTDSNGVKRLIDNRVMGVQFVDLSSSIFKNPDSTFTGYAADGFKYTSGIKDGSTSSTWSTETIQTIPDGTRGDSASFPDRILIVTTQNAVQILDADTLTLWMRFTKFKSVLDGNPVTGGPKPRPFFAEGILAIPSVSGGVVIVNFVDDVISYSLAGSKEYYKVGIVNRNDVDPASVSGWVQPSGAPSATGALEEVYSIQSCFVGGKYIVVHSGRKGIVVSDVRGKTHSGNNIPTYKEHKSFFTHNNSSGLGSGTILVKRRNSFNYSSLDLTQPNDSSPWNWSTGANKPSVTNVGNGILRLADEIELQISSSSTRTFSVDAIGATELGLRLKIQTGSVTAANFNYINTTAAYSVYRPINTIEVLPDGRLFFVEGGENVRFITGNWWDSSYNINFFNDEGVRVRLDYKNAKHLNINHIVDVVFSGDDFYILFGAYVERTPQTSPNIFGLWKGSIPSTVGDRTTDSASLLITSEELGVDPSKRIQSTALTLDPQSNHLFLAIESISSTKQYALLEVDLSALSIIKCGYPARRGSSSDYTTDSEYTLDNPVYSIDGFINNSGPPTTEVL